MKILKKILLLSIFIASNAMAEFFHPYHVDNPEKIEWNEGYCKNGVQEKKLWNAIYKTAKHAIDEIPGLPPEQRQYIESELDSKNSDRIESIIVSPIFSMHVILIQLKNVKTIAEDYLLTHESSPQLKKLKMLGEVLLPIYILEDKRGINNKTFQNSLAAKNYLLTAKQLKGLEIALTNFNSLKRNLAHQIICYGEKNNF